MPRKSSLSPLLNSIGLGGLILSLCGALTLIGNVSGIAGNTQHFVPVVTRDDLPGLMISTAFFAVLALLPTFVKPPQKSPAEKPAAEPSR
ncbi:MAG: hypothetical protein Q7P63_16580 [Verrucomicrobiota bacterium JB022]|nr:hypothetical protein [Verrucomicrobiota bacterium JB022]